MGGSPTFFDPLKVLKLIEKPLKKGLGTFVSNVKKPIGYDLPGFQTDQPLGVEVLDERMQPKVGTVTENVLKSGQGIADLLKAGSRTLTGNDMPVFDPNEKASIGPRHFLLRKEMGMDDESANILGGKDTFIDKGENTYEFNPDNEYGKKQKKQIGDLANKWMQHKMETATRDGWTPNNPEPDPMATFKDAGGNVIPQTQYPYQLNNAVLGNFGFEQKGEGEDEKGYYVKVGGRDVWDFGLKDNEKVLDTQNLKNIPVNLLRKVLDNMINPVNVDFEEKVYIPGVKKQPKRKKSGSTSPIDQTINDGDRY